jgi:two-component system chemotaxis response regulator CheB
MQAKIKVLIVDDSVLFRTQIQQALKDCSDIEVIGTASNGKLGADKAIAMDADLVTMDIEMPEMDGITATKELRARGFKGKIILFSSLSKAGAEKTLEGLRNGASDFSTKPASDGSVLTPADKIKDALLPKILALFGRSSLPKPVVTAAPRASGFAYSWETFNPQVLVIASSTGGPPALVEFFKLMKEPVGYPILVTQHMPPLFTASLAQTLGESCGKVSKEAVQGEPVVANRIYVAPGDFHMSIGGDKANPIIVLDQKAQRNYVRPCADFLFETAARIYGRNTLGIVFTGMGRDGADGAKAIKEVNGAVLIQNEETCAVFGMPAAVYEAGHFDLKGSPTDLAIKTSVISKIRRVGHVA